MDRYAVLGQPIAHSLSPKIHALFAQQTGADLRYEATEVAPAALTETLARLHADGYAGLNLTLPHKIAASALCIALSERATIAGCVNTLVRDTDGWSGDNTDGAGLLQDLRSNLGIAIAGKRVLVLGAGGAARGILAPLLAENPKELAIAGRTPWKAEELATVFAKYGPVRPCTLLALKGDQFDLLINATSAGHAGASPKLLPGLLADDAVAYDLSYGEAARPFLDWARSEGVAHAHDGLGMLVEQAALAFEKWRGSRPQTLAIREGLLRS